MSILDAAGGAILKLSRTLLYESELGPGAWNLSISHASMLFSHQKKQALQYQTPFEYAGFSRVDDFIEERCLQFGAFVAYSTTTDELFSAADKIQGKAQIGRFVGLDIESRRSKILPKDSLTPVLRNTVRPLASLNQLRLSGVDEKATVLGCSKWTREDGPVSRYLTTLNSKFRSRLGERGPKSNRN